MKRDERLLGFARRMRHDPAPTERAVWTLLRDRRLAGFKFRRQHPIGSYVADFYCPAALVVVELDGGGHAERGERDRERDDFFRGLGIKVLRVWNPQSAEDREALVEAVFRLCSDRVAALPEHPRHAGVTRWECPDGEAPSPAARRNRAATSPPGER